MRVCDYSMCWTVLPPSQEHIHDVNAFVRSRCLQIWQQLAIAKVIPVGRLVDSLLEKTCGRLQDKSSIVRKCAVQFLSVCLQGNPYSSNVSFDWLSRVHPPPPPPSLSSHCDVYRAASPQIMIVCMNLLIQ